MKLTILFLVLLSQTLGRSLNGNYDMQRLKKLKMTHDGFYGDTFSDGFGGFQTMKKRGYQVTLIFNLLPGKYVMRFQNMLRVFPQYVHT